jgi:flagellar basal-body rod protein FlgF
MENASLVALSRQVVLRRQLDIIANNVANMNTVGFRRETLELEAFEMPEARANTFRRPDRVETFVSDWGTTTDFSPGGLVQSGNPLDVAIEGEGFLAVETPDGERYTRAGNLTIDVDGTLTTQDGYPVMGDGGPIVFGAEETDISIGRDGSISTNTGPKDVLRLVDFADPATLRHVGENLFAGENPLPATGARVMQGTIEESNVNGVAEMTRLIEVTRAYEQVARLVKDHDDLRSRAIQRLGQLQS